MQEQRTIKYNKYVVAEDFLLSANYNSVMQLPFFLRAVINTSSKEYLTEKKQSINALASCLLLSGQRSTPTRAKKSIAAFKLREGALIGSRTTLRNRELHTIIEKLLIFVLPRLYSETQNSILLENTSLLFLNKNSKGFKPYSTYPQSKETLATIEFTKRIQILSQQERSQLGRHLNFFKSGNNRYKSKNEKIEFKTPINQYTLGIKNLLLIPEMQEFLPLFESVRGIDINIAFAHPRVRVKKTFLSENLFFNANSRIAEMRSRTQHSRNTASLTTQSVVARSAVCTILPGKINKEKFSVQKLPLHSIYTIQVNNLKDNIQSTKQANLVKAKKKLFDKDQFQQLTFTYNKVKQEQSERVSFSFYTPEFESLTYKNKDIKLNDLQDKSPGTFNNQNKSNWKKENQNRSSRTQDNLLTKTKCALAQKQDRQKNHDFNIFPSFKDTTYLKQIRKIFFLTCFQYPS